MRPVNLERLGRLVRTIRLRQGLTQALLARHAGVPRQAVSFLECGHGGRLRLETVRAIADGLGARIDVRLLWNGPELERLLDARHAAVGASVKRLLERWGWDVRVEVSFNHYGERGRIDLLAYRPSHGIILAIEVKSDFVDAQDLLGSMDVKARIAPTAGRRFGWTVRHVVPAIVFAEDRTVRNRVRAVDPLFSRFALRGRKATAWVHRPAGTPTGLLWFTAAPGSAAPPRLRAHGRGRRDWKSDVPVGNTRPQSRSVAGGEREIGVAPAPRPTNAAPVRQISSRR